MFGKLKQLGFIFSVALFVLITPLSAKEKQIAYIVSDLRIPFWEIMSRGIQHSASNLGYEVTVYSSQNNKKLELEAAVKAIKDKVAGIIVSPINSSTCTTILKLAEKANIPVVISDIGTDGGEYVSYISSDNKEGAYQLGKILAKKMKETGFSDGRVGIISIPQKRLNGQLRTAGFMKALEEEGIKGGDIRQQVNFSYKETYHYSTELIKKYGDLRALFLQGSDRYQGALDAIKDSGKKGEILLITFDAEPEFLQLIPKGILVGAGMQQPFLMGEKSVETLNKYLKGETVEKKIELEVLPISTDNIKKKLPIIRRNVLGL